jgi:uncharacterized protein YfaA (DUF2138 family)
MNRRILHLTYGAFLLAPGTQGMMMRTEGNARDAPAAAVADRRIEHLGQRTVN